MCEDLAQSHFCNHWFHVYYILQAIDIFNCYINRRNI